MKQVQDREQNEALALMGAIVSQAGPAIEQVEARLLDQLRSASTVANIQSFDIEMDAIGDSLAAAIFQMHLLGRAQVQADFEAEQDQAAGFRLQALGQERKEGKFSAVVLEGAFEPLPFDEAIDFFRAKTNLSPDIFAALSDAARTKAFAIASGATDQIQASIRDILDRALSEGVTLREFQAQAAEVLERAGVSARAPYYWQTVYRTNLQQSYQVGRWKQVNDPAVRAARPFLRYISARLPTSRQSHVEKHGMIFPVDHPFWDEWMPPNGFNCFCSVQSVSQSLLERRGWQVETEEDFEFPSADTGFQINAGKGEEI